MPEEISVIGAGSWGTALTHLLASKGIMVRLWGHEEEVIRQIRDTRTNNTFLPGVRLPGSVEPTTSLREALEAAQTVLAVVPTQFIRPTFRKASGWISPGATIVSASKGIEHRSLLSASEIFTELFGDEIRQAALSGPSFAKEVAKGAPTAVTLATANEDEAGRLQKLFNSPYFRVYTNQDIMGVEIGGALKNVMAIAAGISDGLGLGHSARAALITRSLAEMTRLGVALGADARTFSGLSGLGDLVLTCTGELSRNRTVGFKLGSGMKLKEILESMKMVAEGVATSRSAYRLAERTGVEMPIVTEVYKVLYRGKSPARAVSNLMSRSLKVEFEDS